VKLLAGAAALAFVAVAVAATGGARSGLRGDVLIEPAFPRCSVGQPCTKPAAHVWLVFKRRGRPARRTLTSDDGSYRIVLRPGTYTVKSPVASPNKLAVVTPSRVTVRRGRFLRVGFKIDIGIR
jgi:hypothetical protein